MFKDIINAKHLNIILFKIIPEIKNLYIVMVYLKSYFYCFNALYMGVHIVKRKSCNSDKSKMFRK